MKAPLNWLLVAIAIACIALQFDGSLSMSSLALGVWLATLACIDRSQMKRLWRPRFWMISLLMALASGILLGRPDMQLGPVAVSRAGIEAGLLMVVRGAFLFALMGSASKLIVSASVQKAIAKLGLVHFGNALTVAFELLPSLSERVRPTLSVGRGSGFVTRVRLVRAAAVDLIRHTALLARSIEQGRA